MHMNRNSAQKSSTMLTDTSLIRLGSLSLDFTTKFDWTLSLTGAEQAASTWRPLAPAGFFPLGDMMVQSFDNPNGTKVAIIARDDVAVGKPALMPPIDFRYVWSGLIFMMVPPEGYVALGGIGCGGDTPDLNLYRCVRKDLVLSALVGDQIYDDRGSNRHDSLAAWAIGAPTAREKHAILSPSTFIPCAFYTKPGPTGFFAFEIELEDQPPAEPPPPPVLTSRDPAPAAGHSVRYIVHMPWFTVRDPLLSVAEQLVNSPIYTMVRTDEYKLANFKNNTQSVPQSQTKTWAMGISQEQVTSFEHAVGIELGLDWSIVKDVFSVSAKLSYQFTYTTSSSHGMQHSEEMADTLTVPPRTAAASYYLASTYDIYRQDGTRIDTESPAFGVPTKTFNTEFPPQASKGAKRRKPAKPPA